MTTGVDRATGFGDNAEALYRRVTLRIVPYIFVCYLFNYLDRVNVGFAKLQMLDALGLNDEQFGLAAGIFFIGYVCCGVPANVALQKFGARRWLSIIMIVWGALSASLAFVHSATAFYVLRFLTGAAEAGFFPGLVLYLTRWFPTDRRGRVMALFMAAIPLSGVVGGPLSGWIMTSFGGGTAGAPGGVGGLQAWQWLFLLQGAPTVALGVGVAFILSDDVKRARWLSSMDRAALEGRLSADAAAQAPAQRAANFGDVLRSPWIWAMGLVYFCVQGGVYAINFWLPSLMRASFGEDLQLIGWLSAAPYAVAAAVMLLVGRSADRTRERRWHLAGPMLLASAGLLTAAWTGGAHAQDPAIRLVALVGVSLGASGALTGLAMFWPLASSFLGAEAAAAGLALINSMGQVAGFVSPYLVGWISHVTGGPGDALAVLAALMIAGVVIVLRSPVAGRTDRRQA